MERMNLREKEKKKRKKKSESERKLKGGKQGSEGQAVVEIRRSGGGGRGDLNVAAAFPFQPEGALTVLLLTNTKVLTTLVTSTKTGDARYLTVS